MSQLYHAGRSSQTSESVNIDYNSAGDHGSEDKYGKKFILF